MEKQDHFLQLDDGKSFTFWIKVAFILVILLLTVFAGMIP